MRDIMLKIKGMTVTHRDEQDQHEDVVEFITEGKLYKRGKTTYVTYLESELSGLEGCRTSLAICENKVKMKRSGKPLGTSTMIEFEKGKRFEGYYDTPFGAVGMEVLTNSITDYLPDANGKGRLSIDYDVSLRGLSESRNKLDIEIM